MQLDVTDQPALQAALADADAALSAVPYYFNLEITKTAIATQTHLCDMGGNTAVVFDQLALDQPAREAGISIVPDCGMGPGLINTMGAYLIELFDEPEEVHLYDGGLPQNPTPPWNYQLTFHINGLTNEYYGETAFLRGGRIVTVQGLTEPELVDIPPLGKLEAFITTGGTSTAPYSFEGRLRTYQNKTLRYPGHFQWFKGFQTLGLFDEQPILVEGQEVIPRQVYHALLEPQITAAGIRDVCVIRARGIGIKDERRLELWIDLVDYYDETTGFTAMERLTGWHCAIMLAFQAQGAVRVGAVPMETAVSPKKFMQALESRGIAHTIHTHELDRAAS
jgi:lysine 6-dehydrogenase